MATRYRQDFRDGNGDRRRGRLREEDPFTEFFIRDVPNRIVVHQSRFAVDLNRNRDLAICRLVDRRHHRARRRLMHHVPCSCDRMEAAVPDIFVQPRRLLRSVDQAVARPRHNDDRHLQRAIAVTCRPSLRNHQRRFRGAGAKLRRPQRESLREAVGELCWDLGWAEILAHQRRPQNSAHERRHRVAQDVAEDRDRRA